MSGDFITRNWALLTASVLALAVALRVLVHLFLRSPSAQLQRALGNLKLQQGLANKARRSADKAEAALDRLRQKSANVRPSRLRLATEALQDARALQKIAEDKLLVAANHVHRIIHEEFPPAKQEHLRAKYLQPADRDKRPFSF